MKVYELKVTNPHAEEDEEVEIDNSIGLFTSKEKAEQLAKSMQKDNPREYYYIQERTLDKLGWL